jgi:PIN domain nuclease of toxin-antitoxin system
VRLLIDTHVVIWWVMEPDRLSKTVDDLLLGAAPEVFVSPISAFEIARKHGLGKLAFDSRFIAAFDKRTDALGWIELPLTAAHAVAAGQMSGTHRDPFDRLLAAQAIAEGLTIATADPALAALGATVVW